MEKKEEEKIEIPQFQEVDSLEALEKIQKDETPAPSNEDGEEFEEETEETTEEVKDLEEKGGSPIKVFAQMLNESGLIEYSDDDFQDSDEYLITKWSSSVNKKAEELLDQIIPDDLKNLFENYQKGVPLTLLVEAENNKINLDSIRSDELEDDEKAQEKLVRQRLQFEDFTADEIDEKIEDYKDNNLLFKEAKSSIKMIKKYDERRIQEEQRAVQMEQERQQREAVQKIKELKSDIFSKDEIIPGIPMTKEDKETFFKGITEVGKDGLTEVYRKAQKDPDWELKTAYFLLMLDGKLDKISKKNKTEITQKFKQNIDKEDSSKFKTKVDIKALERAFK